MSLISLKNISKIYTNGKIENKVLKNLNLEIDKGELIAIMGPSGSGKSTLMNILGCIDKTTEGEYILDGKTINNASFNELAAIRNKKIGFVFQQSNLIEDLKVIDNVIVPLRYNRKVKMNKKEMAKEMLDKVGLDDKIKSYPRELSGGEQQRVAIARALVNKPEIILADEPTGALDSENGNSIMKILKKINEEGKTVIIITHDINIANQCKKVIKIADGKIE